MIFSENFSLKTYNTFGIDAKAKYFTAFESIAELNSILISEIYKNNKTFVLGGGSNVLFKEDYDGLIIHNKIAGICILEDNKNDVIVEVGAGKNWHNFVMWSVSQGLSGIENLALIPGTVGASPIQNIGAYGLEVKDTIIKVAAIEIATQKVKTFSNAECEFQYRNSIFKGKRKGEFIITKVTFNLSKIPFNKTSYGVIAEELKSLDKAPSPQSIAEAVINIRSRKLPNPEELGNSGSFFKNPVILTPKFTALQKKFPKLVGYKISETETKVAAGWLIDNAGLKGYRKADAGVHINQALVLVNYGEASGEEIIALAKEIQTIVKEKYDIQIVPEVNIL
ncbi:MAG: UDP-N-acetylenolpyruvoylglucosamine reductase [Flavobacteriales bacterium TMED123]|nr:MAG: UDP-N-acetylenolpyruvoylglucosamine reductase [Flavobacteriales bacterium TMED123]